MKCPYCNSSFEGYPQYCPNCEQPLSRAYTPAKEDSIPLQMPEEKKEEKSRFPIAAILRSILFTLGIVLAILGIYRLTFWINDYRIDRLYTRGEYTPTINAVTLEDGRPGHSIAFYGQSGDQLFIPELNKTLIITGNVARLNVADSSWFEGDVSEIESAEVSLSPVLITERGERTQLPLMKMEIEVPISPLTIQRPQKNGMTIMTSRYELDIEVVPGSNVFLNGENITSKVTRGGDLQQAVKVLPIGTNTYTLVVRTPQHKERRVDIELYRQAYSINVELDDNVSDHTSNNTMVISGVADPEATLTVESKHMAESVIFHKDTGVFSFIAEMENFGDNIVRFRLSKPGCEDAILSMTVDYSPNLATYSAKAWAMDYAGLRANFARWTGRVFLCEGLVVDSFSDNNGNAYIVMDVSASNEGNYVILQNRSSLKSVTIGNSYSGYADVVGRFIYNGNYYPLLTVRYLDSMGT